MTTNPTSHSSYRSLLFQFSQAKWNKVKIGQLHHQPQKQIINFTISDQTQTNELPPFLQPYYSEIHQHLAIKFQNITNVDVDETGMEQTKKDDKILYFWLGNNPLSFSFINPKHCKIMMGILSDFMDKVDQKDDEIEPFLRMCTQNTAGISQTLFRNIDLFEKLLQNMMKNQQASNRLQNFNIIKNVIRVSNQKIIQIIIKDKYYEFVLRCLRYNPFNDQNYDYYQSYNKLIKIQNILNINDAAIMEAYLDNCKLKFLKDYVVCQFLQFETERIFQNIICLNNVIILERIGNSEHILNDLVKLSQQNPVKYINTFCQLWEIFKATTMDLQFKDIKDNFKNQFIAKELHNIALSAMRSIILSDVQDGRFFQKWLEGLNQFMNHDWFFTQSWILNSNCLGEILILMLDKKGDQSLKQSILNFIRFLIEPTEGRIPLSCRFIQCIYSSFVERALQYFQHSMTLFQRYMEFMMKLYRVEMVRTRRTLVESGVLLRMDKKKRNKYILICIVKMLQTMVEVGDGQVMVYLAYHHCFDGLREEYLRNKCCQNITYSCFLSLFKSIYGCKDKDIQTYLFRVFFPNQHLHEQHKIL